MERTWKSTLAAGIMVFVLVAALVLLGGRVLSGEVPTPSPSPQAETTVPPERAETTEAANSTPDPDDPAIVGEAVGDAAAIVTGSAGEGGDTNYSAPVSDAGTQTEEAEAAVNEPVCTISISCDTILNNMDACAENKKALVPSDGVILPATTVTFSTGESVYDVLQRVCRDYGISMEATFTPMYNSVYVEGIYNLYEFDVGNESGWMYCVNGWFPNYGCSSYTLSDGDVIRWVYTCDLGEDVGDNSMQ